MSFNILDLQVQDIENVYDLYTDEEIENFKCIFEMFDKDKVGFIESTDLQTIMRSLGRDPSEANELLANFKTEQDRKLNFEEFLKVMKVLENKLIASKNAENELESPREATDEEKNKYGSLLPRTGVHFLPDSKVIDFLK